MPRATPSPCPNPSPWPQPLPAPPNPYPCPHPQSPIPARASNTRTEKNQLQLAKVDGIPVIVACMRRLASDLELQELACRALINLATNGAVRGLHAMRAHTRPR